MGVGGVRGVGRSQVGRRWAVADDGLDRARMIAFNGDEVGWVDMDGRVVRHRVWRRRAVADDGVDAATSPTRRSAFAPQPQCPLVPTFSPGPGLAIKLA